MRSFKQKNYAVSKEVVNKGKEVAESGINKFKESFKDPRTYLAIGSLSVAGAGYHMNKQNIKDNQRAREEAHRAGIEAAETNKQLLATLGELNENLKKKKMVSETIVHNNYYPAPRTPRPQQPQQPQERRKFLGLFSENMENRRKLFSIESGSYKGGKRTPGQASYIAGAGLGAGFGALLGAPSGSAGVGAAVGGGLGLFITWMSNIADKSIFNSGTSSSANSYTIVKAVEDAFAPEPDRQETVSTEYKYYDDLSTTVSSTTTHRAVHTQPRGIVYEVDADPRKCTVSVLCKGTVVVLFINSTARQQMSILNKVLDRYCHTYRNADYSSSQVGKDMYLVELSVVQGAEGEAIVDLCKNGVKVNILTGQRFGMKKFTLNTSHTTASDLIDKTVKYGSIGSALGTLAYPIFKEENMTLAKGGLKKGLALAGIGAAVGAGLGLLCGVIKSGDRGINRSATVNNRLLPQVVDILKRNGFKEGKDYTRDPKTADEMKTKVCICVSKYSNDLRLGVNCVSDHKLKEVSEQMVKNLPNKSAVTTKMDDKFNNLSITTISDNSADAGLIEGIMEYFIRRGFPVYIVEVG